MIKTQLALIKRELWEHRALFIVPLVIALIESLGSIVGQVTVSGAGQAVDIALLGATNLGDAERAAAINLLMIGVSFLFVMAMGVLTIFYSLDALYAERKDKSILFWRSLPVTDAETVISKLITAALVIPLITVVMIAATHIVVLTISSIWVAIRGANAWHLIWQAAPFFDNWMATLIILLSLSVWISPFIGWFLFVSAFTKRSPFLIAFLPFLVIPMLEKIFFGSWVFGEMLIARAPFKAPIFQGITGTELFFEDEAELMDMAGSGVSFLSFLDVPQFLTSIEVWLGIAVCGILSFAAIYVRRYRDDS
jgi:ABC-2 type transport system permease protein